MAFRRLACLVVACVSCGGSIESSSAVEDERSPPLAPPAGARAPSTSPATPPRANPSTTCTPSTVTGEIVHACSFPSDVAVVAVTSQYVAIATRTGRSSDDVFSLHRLDRTSAKLESIVEGRLTSTSRVNVRYEPATDMLVWLGT